MEEDLNLDLDKIQAQTEERLKVKDRFGKLSEKVTEANKERDDAAAKATAEAEARQVAEKERDFYKNFNANITKYPNATAHQDQIWDKVKGGYDIEDAMVAVLAKEGKLNMPSEPTPTYSGTVEGGSAPTSTGTEKSFESMTTDDKFNALLEADKTGELADLLRK